MKNRATGSVLGLLMAMLILVMAVPAPAGGEAGKHISEMKLDTWFYVPSTLPETLKPADYSEGIYVDIEDWSSGQYERQYATEASLTFVSGDEALSKALYITEQEQWVYVGGYAEQIPVKALCVSNEELKAPGDALFRLSYKTKDHKVETDLPFHVLSWQDYPFMILSEITEPVTMSIGDYFDNHTILNLVLKKSNDSMIRKQLSISSGGRSWDINLINNDSGAVDDEDYTKPYTVVKSGTWEIDYKEQFCNVLAHMVIPMQALPYRIEGPRGLRPGETAEYRIWEENPDSGRIYTWTLKGEGVSLDAETGKVTASENAPLGGFTLTIVPSDDQPAALFHGTVGTGLLAGTDVVTEEEPVNGFYYAGLSEPGVYSYSMYDESRDWSKNTMSGVGEKYYSILHWNIIESYRELINDPDKMREKYDEMMPDDPGVMIELNEEIVMPDGGPARIVIARLEDDHYVGNSEWRMGQTDGPRSWGMLVYVRDSQMVKASLISVPMNDVTWEELPKVERDDLIRLANATRYDPEYAPFSAKDGRLELSTKEGTTVVTAGKKLTFQAVFADLEKVNRFTKDTSIEWSVSGVDGAEIPDGISISNKGQLTTGKTDTVQEVEVTAMSSVFRYPATCRVTIIPVMKKISVEPAELYFYTGTEMSAEAKAVPDPETVPPLGITWTAAKKEIVEIKPDDQNGTAVIRPLSGGKTVITVKEPGGKSANLTVNVVDPVEDVELSVSGKAVPGSTVTVKEKLVPKQAGNKNVEWSVDVGEEIATISKGKLKIDKNAPVGTVITVTCTAEGAPEPVIRTIQIEVTGK